MKTLLLLPAMLCAFAMHAQQTDSISRDTLYHSPPSFYIDQRKWAVGIEYGYGTAFRKVSDEFQTALVACRNEHETAVTAQKLALKVRYRLNKDLELVSGVSLYNTGFSFQENKQLNDTLNPEFVLGCEIGYVISPELGFTGIGFYDPRYVTMIYGLHPNSGTMHVHLEYDYLDVPVLLRVNVGKKRIRGYAAAGGDVNYLLRAKERIWFTHGNQTFGEYTTTEKYTMYKRWNFGAQAALGAEYLISKSLSLGIQVSGKYHLQSVFRKWNKEYRENQYAAWAGVDVTYRFAAND